MPSLFMRVHSSGAMSYCPGYADICPGNVFEDDFDRLYHGPLSQKFRAYVEKQLLPVCNRCCGLYAVAGATKRLGGRFYYRKNI